jgi:hypothetical protein
MALAAASVSLLATSQGLANCANGGALFQGFSATGGFFTGCGTGNAYAYFWEHHFGVQRVVFAVGQLTTGTSTPGNDSGAVATVADGALQPGGNGPGDYTADYDWGNFGPDGCLTNNLEADASCQFPGSVVSLPVNDIVIAGFDTGNPLHAKAAALSVDANETDQFWIYDQAGATSVDGNPCGADASQFDDVPPACGAIPVPAIQSLGSCDSTGCNLNLSVPAHALTIRDDCAVANSKAIDCPRNMYVGRQIFIKRAPCNATTAANIGTFDTRTYVFDSAAQTVARGFVPYAPQDTNLNGVVDGAEVGPLTPVILAGNSVASTSVHIPKIAGATDCAYLGVAVVLDSAPNTTACGGPCESVVTPLVSVNGTPISLDTATPAADKVLNLSASKANGKANVSWDTSAELSTAGFNLIGTKKNGGSVQLNSSLIQAKQGTTGGSASYSIDLSSGDLKGSTAVYVELVKTNGAKERFGPASF